MCCRLVGGVGGHVWHPCNSCMMQICGIMILTKSVQSSNSISHLFSISILRVRVCHFVASNTHTHKYYGVLISFCVLYCDTIEHCCGESLLPEMTYCKGGKGVDNVAWR